MDLADAALVRVAECECDPRAFIVDRGILKFTGCIASAVAESWLDRGHECPSLPIDLTYDNVLIMREIHGRRGGGDTP